MNNIIPYDYEGQLVRFNSEGWIGATSAAKRLGKASHDWLRHIDTLELLLTLADDLFGKAGELPGLKPLSQSGLLGKYGDSPVLEKLHRMKPGSTEARRFVQEIVRSTGLVKTERGRRGGTWLHPELGVHYAYWLDKKFAIWAGRRIGELLSGQTVALSGPVEFDVQALFSQQVEQMLSGATSGATTSKVVTLANRWRVRLCLRLNSPQPTRQRFGSLVSCVDGVECPLP